MTPLPLLLRADLPEGQERRLDPPLLEPLVDQVLVGLDNHCRAGPRELRPRPVRWEHVVERRTLEVEVALGPPRRRAVAVRVHVPVGPPAVCTVVKSSTSDRTAPSARNARMMLALVAALRACRRAQRPAPRIVGRLGLAAGPRCLLPRTPSLPPPPRPGSPPAPPRSAAPPRQSRPQCLGTGRPGPPACRSDTGPLASPH